MFVTTSLTKQSKKNKLKELSNIEKKTQILKNEGENRNPTNIFPLKSLKTSYRDLCSRLFGTFPKRRSWSL